MEKEINNLTPAEIGEILFLSNQSNGRRRLITNLYNISNETLLKILTLYSNGRIFEVAEADYS